MNLKKTSNKIIITALIAVLMICAAPLSQMVGFDFATAIEAEAADSLTWEVSSTTLTISGTGAMEDYSASSKAPWSSSSAVIKTVVIQDGVTSIGDYAFYWFTSLTSVTMADSVESIGDQAFYNCTSLKTLTIGDGVTTIGTDAFAVCTALTTVTLGDSVEVIDAGAFSWCSALTTITIPASTTLIGENAFYSCDSLKTVNYAVNSDAWAKVSVHSNGNSALGSASFTYGYYVDAPVITSVVVVDYETITINWDLVGYAEGYRVYGLIDGTYANIKTVSGSTSSTYTITDLNPNTEYTFAVRAYDRDADSVAIFGDYSEAYVVSTATAQPVISSTSSTDTTATFSWKAVDGADGYRVYKVVDGVYSSMETISASTLTYTVEGLDYETEYSYAVNAYVRNFDGVAYFLTMSEVATISTTEKILLPSYVEEITVTNGSTWLTLDWEADEGATGYQVYMNGVKIDTLYDSETTYTVTDLDGATDYEFSLRSFSKATGSTVWGTYSDTYTFTTNPFKAKFSSNSSTATSITINWSKTDGADGYRVYMQINGTYTSLETVSASTYSYTISDLDPDTEYSFKVKAYTRDVESVAQFGVASDAYNVSTLSTQVEMTTYSNTTTAIRVNWEEIAGVEGYRVYMLVNGSWVNKGTVYGSDTTTLRIDSLTAGEVYEFYVRAFLRNDEGTAIFQTPSEIMTTQTDLAAAKITSASETSDAIRLNWNEVNGATGYKIYIYENGSWKTYATLYEGDVLTYRMSGFKANTTYKFKVCAFSKETGSTVWGSESSVYSVTTDK